MKFETYERAVEIRAQIDYLETVDGLLQNSAHKQHNIAAINISPYEGGIEITNQTYMTGDLLGKFRQVIRADIDKLNKEFKEL